jgi:hypothetical protein
MWTRNVLATVVVVGVGVSSAFAGTPPPKGQRAAQVNLREAKQAARIADAKVDGRLTRGELDKLRADEAAIRAKEKVYLASGKGLNTAEWTDLQRSLNQTSRQIRRLSHNGRMPGGGQ